MTREEMFERDLQALVEAVINLRNWSRLLKDDKRESFEQALTGTTMLLNWIAQLTKESVFLPIEAGRSAGDKPARTERSGGST